MSKEKPVSRLGIIAVGMAIFLFSTIEIVSKDISQKATIDPFSMVFLRFFCTGVILLALSLPGFFAAGRRFTRADWKNFLLNGLVGVAISISLFHAAILMFGNASSSAVVFSANAVFTFVIARFMNHEPWTVRKWLAVLTAIIGVSLFIFEQGRPSWQALAAIVTMALAAIGFAYSVCLTRKVVSQYGAMLFMGMSSLVGGLLTLPLALWRLPENPLAEMAKAAPELGYVVLVGTTVAYWLYYLGLKHVSAFFASMTFLLKPALASLLAWRLRDQPMNAWTISGMLIVTSAVAIAVLRMPQKKLLRPE